MTCSFLALAIDSLLEVMGQAVVDFVIGVAVELGKVFAN